MSKSPITCHGTCPYATQLVTQPDQANSARLLNRQTSSWGGDPAAVFQACSSRKCPRYLRSPSSWVRRFPFNASCASCRLRASRTTNDDGRCLDLLSHPEYTLAHGLYKIVFRTKEYFDRRQVKSFYPWVEVCSVIELERPGSD
jgi:hypothetical protein